MELKKFLGSQVSKPPRRPSANLLTMSDIITGRTRYSTAAEEGSILKAHDSILWSHGIPFARAFPLQSTPLLA